AQRGGLGRALRVPEVLLVGLIHLLLGLARRVDHLAWYHRVVVADPAPDRLPQAHVVAHPDGDHAPLARGVAGRYAGAADGRLAVVLAKPVPGRAGSQLDVRHAYPECRDDQDDQQDRTGQQGGTAASHAQEAYWLTAGILEPCSPQGERPAGDAGDHGAYG